MTHRQGSADMSGMRRLRWSLRSARRLILGLVIPGLIGLVLFGFVATDLVGRRVPASVDGRSRADEYQRKGSDEFNDLVLEPGLSHKAPPLSAAPREHSSELRGTSRVRRSAG